MAEIPYRLVDSVVRVRGTQTTVDDPYEPSDAVGDIQVELVHRGAQNSEGLDRSVHSGSGTEDFSVQLTADGRLQSIDYKRVGAGPAVVTAGVKLIGFIASTAAGIVGAASRGGALASQDGKGPPPPEPPDPRKDWADANSAAAASLASNKDIADAATTRLGEIRRSIIDADDRSTIRNLLSVERAVEGVLGSARAEIARFEALYKLWRESKRSTRTAAIETVIDIETIPRRAPDQPATVVPPIPTEGPLALLAKDFKVLLEIVDPRDLPGLAPRHSPMIDVTKESRLVRWRNPRPVELWIWSLDSDDQPVLVTRTPVVIADEKCDTSGMELKAGAFGEHGGTWTFNDDGSPGSITTSQTSAAGALADALSTAPESLVGAVEQAKKLTDAVAGIQDGAAERAKAAAERDLAIKKAQVELLGVNATADDIAELTRAEQAVKLRTARRATSPQADAIDDLKAELDEQTTRNGIAAQQRAAEIDGELADLRAEVARLESEVLIAKAKFDLENPGAAPAPAPTPGAGD